MIRVTVSSNAHQMRNAMRDAPSYGDPDAAYFEALALIPTGVQRLPWRELVKTLFPQPLTFKTALATFDLSDTDAIMFKMIHGDGHFDIDLTEVPE